MTQRPSLGKSISIAALIMTGSVFLSRILGLLRELVLAHHVGAGPEMDAYVAAFMLPEIINHILAGGFLSVTFIPIFQQYLTAGQPEKAQRVYSNLLTVGTLAIGIFIMVCWFFTGDMLTIVEGIKGHAAPSAARDPQWIALTTRLTRIILPAQIFLYWGSFFMAVQYAHQRFLLPALMPLLYNLGIILGGLVLGPIWGIEGFAWGVVAGAFVGGVAVQLPGVMRLGIRYKFVFDIRDPDLYKYVLLSLPFIVGLSMTFSNEFLFRFFGLFLSQGAISYLNYSLRVMMLVVGVFGLAIAAASYPFLTRLATEGKLQELSDLSARIVRRTTAIVMPLSALMFVLAPEIISVLFVRGRFTEASAQATAPVLRMYLIGAFAFSASTIVMRNFYAIQNTVLPMIVTTGTVILSLPLYWLLGRSSGAAGIGLAASIGMALQFFVLFAIWSAKRGDKRAVVVFLGVLGRIAAVSLVAGLVCQVIGGYVRSLEFGLFPGLARNLIVVALAGLPSLAVAIVGLDLVKIQSMRESIRLLTLK